MRILFDPWIREWGIKNPYPGSGSFLTPGSGIRDGEKNLDPGSGSSLTPGSEMGEKNPDPGSRSVLTPESWIRDGEKIRIRDPV